MIKTKASILKGAEEVKVIKFEGRKKKPAGQKLPVKKKIEEDEVEKSQSDLEFDEIFSDSPPRKKKKDDSNEFNFQKARKEILNFAISGFENKQEKIDAQVQLAIKLGAKPAKKTYKNYKELLEEKKKEKTEEAKIDKRNIFGASKTLQLRNQKKNKKDEGLLKRYGKVEKTDQKTNSKTKKRRK